MGFHIGDKVIHWTYGLGEIVNIEEKTIHGVSTNCYVFSTAELLIWIPINELVQNNLRKPTPPEEFGKFLDILSRPIEKLPDDRMLRKNQLLAQLKDGQLASICQVVRDLTHFNRITKGNYQEKTILERAINSLLAEWIYSQNVPLVQAQHTLTNLLAEQTRS
jgi:RNA polymerase-interacting CarD/CdnL/TRCF family regulator